MFHDDRGLGQDLNSEIIRIIPFVNDPFDSGIDKDLGANAARVSRDVYLGIPRGHPEQGRLGDGVLFRVQ